MPIFFSLFIIFCVWLSYEIKKSNRLEASYKEDFLKKEHEANLTRRQSTDSLERITLPDNIVFHPDNPTLSPIENKIKETFEHEIINLTGYSNTDLKLEFGRANLDYLSACDGSFTRLVTLLKDWCIQLQSLGLDADCRDVLDFAIDIRSDNTDIFLMRAGYYINDNEADKINMLISVAASLNTLNSRLIADKLSALLIDSVTV